MALSAEDIEEYLGLSAGETTLCATSVTGEPYREFYCRIEIPEGEGVESIRESLEAKFRQLVMDYSEHNKWFSSRDRVPKLYWRVPPEEAVWVDDDTTIYGRIYARLLISSKAAV